MSDSFVLIRLKDQLEKFIQDAKDPGNLPNVIKHIEELEAKARYQYIPQASIEERSEVNSWDHNLDQVIDTIKECINGKWEWTNNSDCKYVGIRIDMRDGGLVITNRGDERISLEQIKYQLNSKDRNIIVNSIAKVITSDDISYGQVVELAYGERANYSYNYTITYVGGIGKKHEGILSPGNKIPLNSGMRFNVSDTSNA